MSRLIIIAEIRINNGNLLYKYLISSDGSLLRVVEGDTEKTTINGSMRTITNGTDDDGKSFVQNGYAKITSDSVSVTWK